MLRDKTVLLGVTVSSPCVNTKFVLLPGKRKEEKKYLFISAIKALSWESVLYTPGTLELVQMADKEQER